ncbi:MAG: patatin-like phospholipase family protein [Cyclobacteriaceae bacterium]
MKQVRILLEILWYALPVQLLINHLKRNQVLLLWWILLFAIVTGSFGNYLGIPYLFLDPVYLNEVSITSFLIMGAVLGGLSMIFHITSYILDGPRFPVVGTVQQPFFTFCINNSLVPLIFMVTYIILVIQYQVSNEYVSGSRLLWYVFGIVSGFSLMTVLFYVYIRFTNKDIFRYVVGKVDETLKENITATRASALKKLGIARARQIRIDAYISRNFQFVKIPDDHEKYDRAAILQVFDQNHFNLVSIELILFAILVVIGIFNDYPAFQIPAAATIVIIITIFVMFTGAFTYWFGSWAGTAALLLFILINLLVRQDIFNNTYKAYGLDYNKDVKPEYSEARIRRLSSGAYFTEDSLNTISILNNWRQKFDRKPKMVLICVSGGGQRAALWSYNVLQELYEQTSGKISAHNTLITGASGGLIGAAYFRELSFLKEQGEIAQLNDPDFRDRLGQDNLNALYEAEIPMMILAPTIVNDGRKLYIAAQPISYMINPVGEEYGQEKVTGVEFLRFFEDAEGERLRFLSALRMNATFPYITPNVTLPSKPPLEIMDAGVNDNFGISDAVRFMYVFREWIERNTSGVILVSIRDSDKNPEILERASLSLLERLTLPISTIYQNFQSMQDITNDTQIEFSQSWLDVPLDRIDIQYVPDDLAKENLSVSDSLRMENQQRASLSWRLTGREKESLLENIHTIPNQQAIRKIRRLLADE